VATNETHERLRDFDELCRQQGFPLTVQRRTILEAVLERTDHPTADQVYEEVKERLPGVSRTTVYRVLQLLTRVGAITRIFTRGAAARFDPVVRRHHHFVCVRCDGLVDLWDEGIGELVRMPSNPPGSFEIEGFSVYFFGTCATCRATWEGAEGEPGAI
jgi:Fur family peroxide stress response transcriptional regulator